MTAGSELGRGRLAEAGWRGFAGILPVRTGEMRGGVAVDREARVSVS